MPESDDEGLNAVIGDEDTKSDGAVPSEEQDDATVPASASGEGVVEQEDSSSESPSEGGGEGGEEAAEPESGGISRPEMEWYVLRVASNREEQVCEALKRKVKIEDLGERIGRILVPTQREKRMRGRVARVYDRKLYPGYVFIEMTTEEDGSVPEDVWFMVKETMSVGDFIGSDGKPTAMKPHDVEKMLAVVERSVEQPTLAGMAGMKKGDPIKVKEGPFENFEGEIDEVFPDKGQVRVIVTIFGRATPIDLEYWQVELT